MAHVQDLEQPLVVNSRQADSIRDKLEKLACRCAIYILKVRFHEHICEIPGIEDAAKQVAVPLVALGVLVIAMVLSTAGALCHLQRMSEGLSPQCVAFESQEYTLQNCGLPLWMESPSDWTQRRFEEIMQVVGEGDVQYTYFLMVATDIHGHELHFEASVPWKASAPWNLDVSHLAFPVFLKVAAENAIYSDVVIKDNKIVQVMNPLWLVISCSCLWGWVAMPVFGPIGHLLQLGSVCLVVESAGSALLDPPEIHPSMGDPQFQNFSMCNDDQGLSVLSLILIFQTIIACLILPVGGAVGQKFPRLIKLSATLNAIKVSHPSDDLSCNICPVCLDQLGSRTVWILKCSHAFHKDCVLPWLLQEQGSLRSCPTCRASTEQQLPKVWLQHDTTNSVISEILRWTQRNLVPCGARLHRWISADNEGLDLTPGESVQATSDMLRTE